MFCFDWSQGIVNTVTVMGPRENVYRVGGLQRVREEGAL